MLDHPLTWDVILFNLRGETRIERDRIPGTKALFGNHSSSFEWSWHRFSSSLELNGGGAGPLDTIFEVRNASTFVACSCELEKYRKELAGKCLPRRDILDCERDAEACSSGLPRSMSF